MDETANSNFNKTKNFLMDYADAIGLSRKTRLNFYALTESLLKNDILHKTKFETSFKFNNGRISRQARFLYMDANAYSCKSKELFLLKLLHYRKIISETKGFKTNKLLFKAFEEISTKPMDLYFGADIAEDDFVYAFWLIFGGVKKTGQVVLWPYNFRGIIKNFFRTLQLKNPQILDEQILNLGVDIYKNKTFYKIYYLLRGVNESLMDFSKVIKKIDKEMSGLGYYYFYSHMFDHSLKCIKKKVYLEFTNHDLIFNSNKTKEVLKGILSSGGMYSHWRSLYDMLKPVRGRISILSIEPDMTITFYMRAIGL